ncbi:TIGR03016 family PEP-CTERM system-associated outer membrane protein [Azohydromonas aeria]|uniref:TIGR03016 family PEP-CTERM system-associated outer membrane protein n=1 Tax=Azohydromonas aeria TaxID=2590212 RepID=UPI0012FC0D36|nr:TIGR03016 family PEP-CTERM system-associated outer membrane protein [Azohydromonas aeria]
MKSLPLELLPVLGLLAVAAAPAQAQAQARSQVGVETEGDAARTQPRTFVPRLSISETATSNVNLRAAKQSDLITSIAPGLYASSRGGRVQGFVDYSLSGLLYAQDTRPNQLLNALRANGSAEVLENTGFIDASASITQQAVNPLGVQSADAQLGRDNQTEVRTLQLAPRLQGRLGAGVDWSARASHQNTSSTSDLASNSSSSTAQLDIGNGSQPTRFGWSAQASRTQRSFSRGRTTDDDILRGVLQYRPGPDFSAGVIGGYESTDIASVDKQGRATYGLQLNWAPSARSQLRSEVERRFFGNAYNVAFSYRWPRAALNFSDTRAMSNGAGQLTQINQGTNFSILDQQLASTIKDAAERENAVLEELKRRNLDPNAVVLVPFLSSGVTLSRAQQLSLAWLGARDTLTLTVQQSSTERLDAVTPDPLLNGAVRQRGYSLTLAHRLTPLSNLSLSLSQSRNRGRSSVSTELRTATAQWSTALGPRSNFSLLGRRTLFTSSTQPYDESALIGTLGMTF